MALAASSIEVATVEGAMSAAPVCGNSVCEVREGSTRAQVCGSKLDPGCLDYCEADCPGAVVCPLHAEAGDTTGVLECGGYGACLLGGTCDCEHGYEGLACASCMYGFVATLTTTGGIYCAPTPIRYGSLSANTVPPPPAPGSPSASSTHSVGVLYLTLAALSVLAALIL